MQFVLQPWELAFTFLASWVNREQQESNVTIITVTIRMSFWTLRPQPVQYSELRFPVLQDGSPELMNNACMSAIYLSPKTHFGRKVCGLVHRTAT